METIDKSFSETTRALVESLKEALPDLTVEVILGFINPFIKLYSEAPPKLKKELDHFIEQLLILVEYGAFFQVWNRFELMIEVSIMKELRLTPVEASIVCGGLNFSPKVAILYSLLREKENEEAVTLIRKAQDAASRNSLAHGLIIGRQLFRREVKNEYAVRSRPLDNAAMRAHGTEFINCFEGAMRHLKVTDNEINDYIKSIAELAPIHEARASRRREFQTSSGKATKKPPGQTPPEPLDLDSPPAPLEE